MSEHELECSCNGRASARMVADEDGRMLSSTGMEELLGYPALDELIIGASEVHSLIAAHPSRDVDHAQKITQYEKNDPKQWSRAVVLRHHDGHVFAARKFVDVMQNGNFVVTLVSCEHENALFRVGNSSSGNSGAIVGNEAYNVVMGEDTFHDSVNWNDCDWDTRLLETRAGVSMWCKKLTSSIYSLQRICGQVDDDDDSEFPRAISSHWTLDRKIDHGGFSKIYSGSSVGDSPPTVCIKAMEKRDCERLELYLYDIDNEVAIHTRLHHDNIVQLIDTVETTTHVYMVMELLAANIDLLVLHEDGLGEERAQQYFVQMARAVDYLHSKYIVHRDIKLKNFCMCREPDAHIIKLIDFGFAEQKTADTWLKRTLITGCGSLVFSSPEVREEAPLYAGWEADMYSLGVTLWVLVTDERPCRKTFIRDALLVAENYLSKPLWDLLSAMLEENPKNRADIRSVMRSEWVVSEKEEENGK